MSVNSDIFIDKSEMIHYLNMAVQTQQRYVSVSRPRRFGKTMAADMICAYYDKEADSRKMFSSLKIAKASYDAKSPWDKYLGKFDVIRIVMTKFTRNKNSFNDALDSMQMLVSNIDYDDYVGRIGVGRVERGTFKLGQQVTICKADEYQLNYFGNRNHNNKQHHSSSKYIYSMDSYSN